MIIVDSLMWVPLSQIGSRLSEIEDELTLTPDVYKGEPESIRLYRREGEYLGVPRMWGFRREWLVSGESIKDDTSMPEMKWPKIRFPDGGDYWEGQERSVGAITDAFLYDGEYGALLEAPCGSGKTLMGLDIASRLNTPTFVCVHKESLGKQWVDTAKKLFPGVTTGWVQGKRRHWGGRYLVVGMTQTLYSQRESFSEDMLRGFGLVIFDEGHRYPARTFEKVLRLFPSRFRLGVSATWRRRDGLGRVWYMHCGQVIHRTKVKRLGGDYVQIKLGVPSVKNFWRAKTLAGYLTEMALDKSYNKWLADQLIKGSEKGRRMLLISDRIVQLTDIREMLKGTGVDRSIGLYCRSYEDPNTGKRIKLENTEIERGMTCDIVLASYHMMMEGVDIPELDTLIFGTPRADVEQVVGRIQRPKKDKKRLLIVDPIFVGNSLQRGMAKKRVDTYRKLGFERYGEKVV